MNWTKANNLSLVRSHHIEACESLLETYFMQVNLWHHQCNQTYCQRIAEAKSDTTAVSFCFGQLRMHMCVVPCITPFSAFHVLAWSIIHPYHGHACQDWKSWQLLLQLTMLTRDLPNTFCQARVPKSQPTCHMCACCRLTMR